MYVSTDPEHAELARAKSELLDAARAIDPLAPLRRQPLLSVGVAAGIGALLAMNAERLFSPGNLNRAFSWLARTAALTLAASRTISPRQSPLRRQSHED